MVIYLYYRIFALIFVFVKKNARKFLKLFVLISGYKSEQKNYGIIFANLRQCYEKSLVATMFF